MAQEALIVAPAAGTHRVRMPDGTVTSVPKGWKLLPPGDAGLTRKVKSLGPSWTVKEKKGRRTFSKGVWAPAANIAVAKREIEATRSSPAYQKKIEASRARREKKQVEYVDDFRDAVLHFLGFDPRYADLADKLSTLVTRHATPVGSGTVARTQRIPLSKRAGAAVIAWMRHQTTAYDDLKIARVKGERRRVRAELAGRSRKLLDQYRRGDSIDPQVCPLAVAVHRAWADQDSDAGAFRRC